MSPLPDRGRFPAEMMSPVRHKWCGKVFDVGRVTVLGRYADCSTFLCPGCGAHTDDRAWTANGCEPVSRSEGYLDELGAYLNSDGSMSFGGRTRHGF